MEKITRAEQRVADFLKGLNVWWEFQPALIIKDKYNKNRIVYPDFFLPSLGIYVEVCGADRPEKYLDRRKMYKNNQIPVIFVETFKPDQKWKAHFLYGVDKVQKERQKILTKIEEIRGFKQESLKIS